MSTATRRIAEGFLLALILAIVAAILYTAYYAAAVLGQVSLGILGALSGVAILGLVQTVGRLR